MPTEMQDYLFDLQGYIIIKNALSSDEVNELNTLLDDLFAQQAPPDPEGKKKKGYEI